MILNLNTPVQNVTTTVNRKWVLILSIPWDIYIYIASNKESDTFQTLCRGIYCNWLWCGIKIIQVITKVLFWKGWNYLYLLYSHVSYRQLWESYVISKLHQPYLSQSSRYAAVTLWGMLSHTRRDKEKIFDSQDDSNYSNGISSIILYIIF